MLRADVYGGSRTTTPRENQVITLINQGCTNREIGDILGTTEHVIKNYLRRIYDKLGLDNRVEVALWYEHQKELGKIGKV